MFFFLLPSVHFFFFFLFIWLSVSFLFRSFVQCRNRFVLSDRSIRRIRKLNNNQQCVALFFHNFFSFVRTKKIQSTEQQKKEPRKGKKHTHTPRTEQNRTHSTAKAERERALARAHQSDQFLRCAHFICGVLPFCLLQNWCALTLIWLLLANFEFVCVFHLCSPTYQANSTSLSIEN